jgi:Flp pilus assembly protein TadG
MLVSLIRAALGRPPGSRSRSLGQTATEFALVSPILLAVTFGLIEGGYYVYATTSVNHATQEGARRAILPSTPNIAAVQDRVNEAARPFDVPAADVTVTILDQGNGSSKAWSSRERGDKVVVTTAYRHEPLAGFAFPGLTFEADARSEMWVE